jgi:hypothetical protein
MAAQYDRRLWQFIARVADSPFVNEPIRRTFIASAERKRLTSIRAWTGSNNTGQDGS